MSLKFDCYLDVNEDNVAERNVSSSMRSFRCVRSMNMVGRIQTVGRLEAVFLSYSDDFLKLFKHGRRIELRARPGNTSAASFDSPVLYTGYVREVHRLPGGTGELSVTAEHAFAWLHNDDDTAVYVNFSTSDMIDDVLSHSSVSAPWHQAIINPQGLAPGTYQYGVVGSSVVAGNTLVGAYYPRGVFERSYQRLGRVDAIVLDVDSSDRSGSLYSLLSKAVLSEAGYLLVEAGTASGGSIGFLGRYGRAFSRVTEHNHSLTAWNGVDYAAWRERVSELMALSPLRITGEDVLFKTLRNFHVPRGRSFYQFENYVNGFPVELEGNVRLEGLPDDVECRPGFSGFHLYLHFENSGRDLAIIEELAIYADVVRVDSVTRQVARTGNKGGQQAVLELANLAGAEDTLLEHYVDGMQAQNELGAIYLLGSALESARGYDLMDILDLKRGGIDEAAYVQSMEWSYSGGAPRLRIGLWPFVDYDYGLVGKSGNEEVGEIVVGI